MEDNQIFIYLLAASKTWQPDEKISDSSFFSGTNCVRVEPNNKLEKEICSYKAGIQRNCFSRKANADKKDYKCFICDRRCTSKAQLIAHTSRMHASRNENPFQRATRSKEFSQKVHAGKETNQCSTCSKGFPQKGEHTQVCTCGSVATTTVEMFYARDEDGKSLNQRSRLKYPLLNRTVEKLDVHGSHGQFLDQSTSLECPLVLIPDTAEKFNRYDDGNSLDQSVVESPLPSTVGKFNMCDQVAVSSHQNASLKCALPTRGKEGGQSIDESTFTGVLETPALEKLHTYEENDKFSNVNISLTPSSSHTVDKCNGVDQRSFVKCPFPAPTVDKFRMCDDRTESSDQGISFKPSSASSKASLLTRTVEKLKLLVQNGGKVPNNQKVSLKYPYDTWCKSFSQNDSLKSHVATHVREQSHMSDLGDNSADVSASLKPAGLKFQSAIYVKDRPYKCDQCGELFTVKNSLSRHMKIHTGKKLYKCEDCGKTFSQSGTLKIHRRTHTGERPYICNLCGKSFIRGEQLQNHIRSHTGEKPHKCDQCGRGFSASSHLKDHMRIHDGLKLYKCDVCHIALTRRSSLKVHMKIHSKEKSYQCGECGKCFIRRTNMKTHMKRHLKRPFKCAECSKDFVSASALETHEKSHSAPKKVKKVRKSGKMSHDCDTCGKSFAQGSTLTRHMKIHTGTKPHKCEYCSRCFIQSTNLKQHMQTHISGENRSKGK